MFQSASNLLEDFSVTIGFSQVSVIVTNLTQETNFRSQNKVSLGESESKEPRAFGDLGPLQCLGPVCERWPHKHTIIKRFISLVFQIALRWHVMVVFGSYSTAEPIIVCS